MQTLLEDISDNPRYILCDVYPTSKHTKLINAVIQRVHGVCSVTCILTIFFCTLQCFVNKRSLTLKFVFVPMVELDFGYFVVNDIKYDLWLNAYFVKELH